MLQLEFCLLKFFVFFDGENKEIGETVNEYNLPTEFYGVRVLAEIFAPARSHQGVLDSVISTRHGEGAAKDLKTIVCSVFLQSPGLGTACWVALDCVNLRDATQDPSLKAWA